jgi:hypothetical protein
LGGFFSGIDVAVDRLKDVEHVVDEVFAIGIAIRTAPIGIEVGVYSPAANFADWCQAYLDGSDALFEQELE